ncbi:MAG: response regulator transcription factor [Anaerolineales bacterium]|nr:response regulator transcription factor [Anaerolineales bacterium]
MISVFLLDDCAFSREGIQKYLACLEEVRLAAVCENEAQGLAHFSGERLPGPAVLLWRYDLERAVAPVEWMKTRQPQDGFSQVVYRAPDDEGMATEMLAAGMAGYVVKGEPLERIREVLVTVARGETWVSPMLAPRLVTYVQRQTLDLLALTEGERRVVPLLAEGLKNPVIAARLSLAEQSVKNTLCALRKKLDVWGRTELVEKARELDALIKLTNYTGGG